MIYLFSIMYAPELLSTFHFNSSCFVSYHNHGLLGFHMYDTNVLYMCQDMSEYQLEMQTIKA